MLLISVFAAVAVPGSAGSRGTSPETVSDANLYFGVEVSSARGTQTMTPALDPAYRSDGALDTTSVLLDPDSRSAPSGRPPGSLSQPAVEAGVVIVPTWHFDGNVSWYGPGFYGKRTACGVAMTESLLGVAHRTLACGTRVSFKNPANGKTITVPVVDRGPYVSGRDWDLTGGACIALGHCYTGSMYWKWG
jgi:rare lipoprotein A (RlpA)-like double-psi beta-barrel protein